MVISDWIGEALHVEGEMDRKFRAGVAVGAAGLLAIALITGLLNVILVGSSSV